MQVEGQVGRKNFRTDATETTSLSMRLVLETSPSRVPLRRNITFPGITVDLQGVGFLFSPITGGSTLLAGGVSEPARFPWDEAFRLGWRHTAKSGEKRYQHGEALGVWAEDARPMSA